MSWIRLGLVLLSSLVVAGYGGLLWGQNSTLKSTPPVDSKLENPLVPVDSDPSSAHSTKSQSAQHRKNTQGQWVKESENSDSEHAGNCDSNSSLYDDSDCSQSGPNCGARNTCEECPSLGCHKCADSDCTDTLDPITAAYCQRMAKLLSATLQADRSQTDDQQKAIEAALLMVTETIEANSKARIRELDAQHQMELANLQAEFNERSATSATPNQLRDWLGPIYANQNRNYRQLQLLDANCASLTRSLKVLEDRKEPLNVHAWKKTYEDRALSPVSTTEFRVPIRQPDDSATQEQVKQIQDQIKELQQQLERLQRYPVQPAKHLEPIFTPDQPLKPLYERR